MITRDGTIIIIPCPNCEHDMLEQNGLDVDNKTLTAKCHKCGQTFNVHNLNVFRCFDLNYSDKCRLNTNTPVRMQIRSTLFDNLN